MATKAQQARFLAEIAPLAVDAEERTGVPARMTVAQACAESDWGVKPIGTANYFGIKKAKRHHGEVLKVTHEEMTEVQAAKWLRDNPGRQLAIIEHLPSGRIKVRGQMAFADFTSLREAIEDYCWLITNGEPYRKCWTFFLHHNNVDSLIGCVAHVYATAGAYAKLVTDISKQRNVTWAIAAARAERRQYVS